MIKLIFEALAWGLASGIVGATYRGILAEEPAFNAWWRFGARFESKWFFKPVWSCGHCAAGQFALWTYIYLKIVPAAYHYRFFNHILHEMAKYTFYMVSALFCLIIAISAAVLVAKLLQLLLNRLQ